ncbi:MAG TPA: IS21-like element helper ATPase IstB, partial [Candidatus Nitrosotenuis sp.]|nr:IS21-like element helper ATPase IstB [Candidatus Nitrosotenuis sp.]
NRQAIEEKLSYPEFLALVLGDEYERRENKKLGLRLRKANFQGERTLENFNFDLPGLKLNKPQIFDLATCMFVDERVNVLIVGPTGVGKSHLAQAIGHQACRRGYDVLFCSFHKMLGQLRAGRADNSYDRKLQNYLRPDLLVLDDFGLKPLQAPADEDFHELVTERYERGSIIITSNLDFPEWGTVFPNPVLGAATIDRLRHQAYRVVLEGDSYRKPRPMPTDQKGRR